MSKRKPEDNNSNKYRGKIYIYLWKQKLGLVLLLFIKSYFVTKKTQLLCIPQRCFHLLKLQEKKKRERERESSPAVWFWNKSNRKGKEKEAFHEIPTLYSSLHIKHLKYLQVNKNRLPWHGSISWWVDWLMAEIRPADYTAWLPRSVFC